MAQNRVTIIAELKDHITGPTTKAAKSVEDLGRTTQDTSKKTDRAGKTTEQSFQRIDGAAGRMATNVGKSHDKAGKAAERQAKDTHTAAGRIDKAFREVSGSAKTSATRVSQAFQETWADAERGPHRLVAAMKSAGAQIVTEARTTGQKAGDGLRNGIQSGIDGVDISALQGALGGLGVAGGVAGSLDREGTSKRAAISADTDPEQMRTLTETVFNEGLGTDYQQITDNAISVIGTFDIEPGSPEAEALLRGNATLTDVFPELDADALTMAVKLVADTDGISFQQAQANLFEALQKATPKGRDEMLDNIQEYTPFLQDTGIPATALVTMLSGATERGSMASDKTGDAIKEFGVRAIDTSNKGYADDYAELGIDQADISRRLQSGDASAFTDVVKALDGIEDQATQARLAVGIFGTPLEDLGVGNIDEQISAWSDLDMAITGTTDKLDGATDELASGAANDWDTAWRELTQAFIDIGDALAPVVSLLADVISFLAKPIAFVSTILAAGGALKMLLVPLNGVLGLFGKTLTMSALLRGGLSLLWKLFMVTPLGRAITIITALALGFKWLYENVGWARDAMDWFYNSMVKGFQVFDDIGEKIDTLITEKIPALRAALDFGNGATEADDRSWGERVQDAGAAAGEALGLPDMSGNRDERADRHEERGFLPWGNEPGGTTGEALEGATMPGFASGGYTGDIPTTEVAGAVHGREFVFDAASTASIGVHNLEAARSAGTLPVAATLGTAAPAPVVVQGDTVAIHIEDARDPGAVIRQIEAFFAQRDQARALTYATPSLRGAY